MPQQNTVFGLIENYLSQGRNSRAMRELTRISNEYSKNERFLELLAQTQLALADTAGLIKTLAVMSRISNTTTSHFKLMQALYTEGRLNEALDVGLKLQEMDLSAPEKSSLDRLLVGIYLEFNDYEGIEELARGAAPDDFILWAMGLVFLVNQNRDGALENFRMAIEMNPANDRAWVSLAMLHEEMGDRELALANLEKALDANSTNALALKLMMKWHRRTIEKSNEVISRVKFYMSQYDFDEEMSLWYVQILKENNMHEMATFELSKMILSDPTNLRLQSMKKNLQGAANI